MNFLNIFKYLGYVSELLNLIKSKLSAKELVSGILDLAVPLVEANNPKLAPEIDALVAQIKDYLAKN